MSNIVASRAVPNADLVRAQLERILQSRQFRRAEIAGRILRVIVEQTLSQKEGIPCEKSIGPAVFGDSYLPASTSSIRVRIRDIRQKLRDYYQSIEPSRDTVRIEIPEGRYRASFSYSTQPGRPLSSIDSGRKPGMRRVGLVPFVSFADSVPDSYGYNVAFYLGQVLGGIRGVFCYSRPIWPGTPEPALRFRGFSDDLALDVIVHGSVSIVDGSLCATVNTVDAKTEITTWTGVFPCDLNDLGFVHRIAAAVARQILGERAPSPRGRAIPCNAAAAAAYSEGIRLWTQRSPDSIRGAAACFQAALAADPAYSPAHVGLAHCYLFRVILGERPQSVLQPALEAALKAVALDPESAAAHAALGAVRSILQFSWADAESEFAKARALDPDAPDLLGWYSGHAAVLGRFSEAIETVSRLEFVEPLSFFVTAHAAKVLFFCGDYSAALARLSALVTIVSGMDLAHSLLGMTQCALGDFETGIRALERGVDLSQRAPRNLGTLGYYLAAHGRADRAEAILSELRKQAETGYVPQTMPAALLAGLGRADEAFACLDRAFADGDFFLALLRVWPPLLSLRSDPRYQILLDRVFGTRQARTC